MNHRWMLQIVENMPVDLRTDYEPALATGSGFGIHMWDPKGVFAPGSKISKLRLELVPRRQLPVELESKSFHSTCLNGLIVTTIDNKMVTRFEQWCGQLPEWVKHLRTWDKSGTVQSRQTPNVRLPIEESNICL
jgi:hypothetical protein